MKREAMVGRATEAFPELEDVGLEQEMYVCIVTIRVTEFVS